MAKSRLIGGYPVIGIRPTIDGRRGKAKIREGLEEQTMNMAKAAKKLIEENVFYSNGEKAKVIIADTTIGRVAEAAACADKFKKAGVDITLTVTPCWCYGAETMDMDPMTMHYSLKTDKHIKEIKNLSDGKSIEFEQENGFVRFNVDKLYDYSLIVL